MNDSNVSLLWGEQELVRRFRVPGVSRIVSLYQHRQRPHVDFARAYWITAWRCPHCGGPMVVVE